MVYEKETKKSMVYEKYEHFFVVYEIFAVNKIKVLKFTYKYSINLGTKITRIPYYTTLKSYRTIIPRRRF
jgi:hypothetical protein